jgi:hypothetical protein
VIFQKEGCEMRKQAHLEKIEKVIEGLTPQEQLKLVERLAQRLRKAGLATRKELDWSKLYGLGKGLWGKEDAQEYVNRQRENRL